MQELIDGSTLDGRTTLLKKLASVASNAGTEYVSLYFKKLTPDVIEKLRKEVSLTENIKSKTTKNAVKESLNSMITILRSAPLNSPGAAFAYKKDAYYITLPDNLTSEYYRCDKEFFLTPIATYNELKWGLVVMDTKQYTIGLIVNSRIKVLKSEEVFVAGKIKAGGQSSQRFEESRRKEIEHYIGKLSDTVQSIFKAEKVEKILLGGIAPTMLLFYLNNKMTVQMKALLEPPISVVYTDEHGLEQLLEKQKDKFESALKTYYHEVEGYDSYLRSRSAGLCFKLEEILNVKLTDITGAYLIAGADPECYYCQICTTLTRTLCNENGHKSVRLKKYLSTKPTTIFTTSSSRGQHLSTILKSGVAIVAKMNEN